MPVTSILETAPTTIGHWVAMTAEGPLPFTVFMGTDTDTGRPRLRWIWGDFANAVDYSWVDGISPETTDEIFVGGDFASGCVFAAPLSTAEHRAMVEAWATCFRAGAIDVDALLVPFADVRKGDTLYRQTTNHAGMNRRTPIVVERITKTLIVADGERFKRGAYEVGDVGMLKRGTGYHNPRLVRAA